MATDESTNRLRAEANAEAASLSRAPSGGSRAGGFSRAPSGTSRASGTDGVLCIAFCFVNLVSSYGWKRRSTPMGRKESDVILLRADKVFLSAEGLPFWRLAFEGYATYLENFP